MRLFEKRLSDEELLDSVRRNVCKRNQDLVALVRILNHLPNSNVITGLDGSWGSGKTCLIRELEIVWQSEDNPVPGNTLSSDEFEMFQTGYIPFYYNAWENDYAEDPTQSLLMALVEYLEEKDNIRLKSGRRLLGSINPSEFIKEITNGLINPEGVDTNSKILKYAGEVNRSKKLRSVISELIEKKIGLNNGRRFLFIIDDLDRCRPTYAVKLIEAIKNIFSSGKIVFLIATNFAELGNIVRGYYGGYIDGYRYLDRIFDLKIRLSDIDTKSYIAYKLPECETWAVKNVSSSLKMNMRELNRYLEVIYLYDSYFASNYVSHDQKFHNICRYVFIPIVIGYKIKDFEVYNELISGKGYNHILRYFEDNPEMKGYAIQLLNQETNQSSDAQDIIKNNYERLFSNRREDKIDANASFWSILNLTSTSLDLD